MKFTITSLLLPFVAFELCYVGARKIPYVTDVAGFCTISASGGDDAPNFVAAVKQCNTVLIPEKTTLTISTRMDMVCTTTSCVMHIA